MSFQGPKVKLLSEKSTMRFLDDHQVVKVSAPMQLVENANQAKSSAEHTPKKTILASIFSLKSQAEAEPTK